MKRTLISCLLVLCFAGAHLARARVPNMRLPHLMVYKTRGNYNNLVAISLTADKQELAYYPSPGDVKTRLLYGRLLPVTLHKGYLLDKNGIDCQTAFLRISYQAYSALGDKLTAKNVKDMILTTDPLVTLYDCGPQTRFKNPRQALNSLIDKGLLSKKCTVVVPAGK